MTKKYITLITLLAFLAASIFANGNQDEGSKNDNSMDKEVTLELLIDATYISGNDGFTNALNKAQEMSGIKLNISQYPGDQFENVLRTKLATGNAGDIFICSYGLNVMPAEFYAPLDGPWASKITSVTKPSSIRPSDGALVKVPFSGQSNFGLIYNKEVLKKAGVSLPMKDFSEFTAACEAIKKTGVTPIVVPNGENWTAQIFLLSSLTGYYSNNMDITRKLSRNEMKPQDIPELVQFWKNAAALVEMGYVNDNYMSTMQADGEKAVAEGTAAFMCMIDGSYGNISKAYPDKIDDLGMTTTPLWDDEKDGMVLTNPSALFISVPKSSENIDKAQDFINVMISEPVMKEYYSVVPGAMPYDDMGFDLPANSWNKEMRTYSETITPLSDWSNNPFNGELLLNPLWGDFNLQVQSLFAGLPAEKAVEAWYKKYSQDAKAKGLSGF
ncbi:MAG: ABC transporter substrate-binding protein [Spirochaetales bacterium]|nr:ABC transporter substrate-binding protein [Spirochaetales bacterium]